MRISRGNNIIGEYSIAQMKRFIADGTFLVTDTYYDEDVSDWLPLSSFVAKEATVKTDKATTKPCYCGSGLPFHVCHGDGSQY